MAGRNCILPPPPEPRLSHTDPPGIFVGIAVWSTLAALGFSGCVNGRLSPEVAPIVSALDVAACETVSLLVVDKVVGEACSDVAGLVNGILGQLGAAPASSATPPSAPRLALPHVGALGTTHKPIRLHGRTVGHVRADLHPHVQAGLDALPADGGGPDGGV